MAPHTDSETGYGDDACEGPARGQHVASPLKCQSLPCLSLLSPAQDSCGDPLGHSAGPQSSSCADMLCAHAERLEILVFLTKLLWKFEYECLFYFYYIDNYASLRNLGKRKQRGEVMRGLLTHGIAV